MTSYEWVLFFFHKSKLISSLACDTEIFCIIAEFHYDIGYSNSVILPFISLVILSEILYHQNQWNKLLILPQDTCIWWFMLNSVLFQKSLTSSWWKLPVMTCNSFRLCLSTGCFRNFSRSLWVRDSRGADSNVGDSLWTASGVAKRFDDFKDSTLYKCSCNTWTASAACRPCKSNVHWSFSQFLIRRISFAALALSCSAAFHSSRAFSEKFWADEWSPLR